MVQEMLSKEWIRENTGKIKNAYSFAVVNKLNVKSKEDVLQILKKVDPENANEEYAEAFSKVLQLVGHSLRDAIEKRVDEGKL